MRRLTTGKANPSYVMRTRLDALEQRITDLAKGLSFMVDAAELIGTRLDDLEQQMSEIQYPTNPMEE